MYLERTVELPSFVNHVQCEARSIFIQLAVPVECTLFVYLCTCCGDLCAHFGGGFDMNSLTVLCEYDFICRSSLGITDINEQAILPSLEHHYFKDGRSNYFQIRKIMLKSCIQSGFGYNIEGIFTVSCLRLPKNRIMFQVRKRNLLSEDSDSSDGEKSQKSQVRISSVEIKLQTSEMRIQFHVSKDCS